MGLPPAKLSRRRGAVKADAANGRQCRVNDPGRTVTATEHGGT
jgi:hypothetical protein